MSRCPNCATEIIPGAKFCHRCGEGIVQKTKNCPVCRESNPLTSVFCHHCGHHFEGKKANRAVYDPVYPLVFDRSSLTNQIKSLFFKNLRQRVGEEHDLNRYSEIVDRFYDSRFREVYEVRAQQIAEEIWLQWTRFGREALPEIDRIISDSFDGLLDFFIIQYCPDLTGMVLPSAILKYERITPAGADIGAMIQDYLALDRETEVFYFDFLKMPEDALSNACKNFLTAERDEKVFFIGDWSLNGACKEGFAMTDKALYWRAPFGRARKVRYDELYSVQKGKDWLLINSHFFTATPSLNLKMYKLLKKLGQGG
jgi:hypothetical protein